MRVLERPGRGGTEPLRRRGALVAGAALAAVALAALAAWLLARGPHLAAPRAARPIPGEGGRVVVEVLNTTGVLGLARAATHRLRDGGLDVVAFGSDTGAALDSTQVLVRRGPPRAGERVLDVLGVGSVRVLPGPDRLVDVTVRLGRDFAARAAAPARGP